MANNLLITVLISCSILVFVNCVKPECYVCDSTQHDNCKIIDTDQDLSNGFIKECENDLDPGDDDALVCYTKIEGIDVVRGCFVDKDTEFQTTCNDAFCLPCKENACNMDTVPLECIVCNSEENPNCATLQQPITTKEQCEEVGDECFVRIIDGVTHRGCLPAADISGCSGDCDKCKNIDSCNDGIYPVNRLSCHHCNGNTDCNGVQDPDSSYPCQNYDANDLCYIIGIGSFAQRGCLSDADEYSKNCNDNPKLCTLCTESDCNGQDAVVVRDKCYACNEENAYCFAHVDNSDDQSQVEKTCEAFLNYEVKCFTYTNNNQITRGCFNGIREISPPECLGENSDNCEICTGALCNLDQILENGDTCIDCDSLDDPNCNDPAPFAPVPKECFSDPRKITGDRCYVKFDTNTKRGCITDLDGDMLAECTEDTETCKTCPDNACNIDIKPLECIKCNSKDDPNCATLQQSITTKVQCEKDGDECFVQIIDGVTHRGCLPAADVAECSSDVCKTCADDSCNDDIYPVNRLSCYHCNGHTDCNGVQDPDSSYPCQNYDADDQCYIIGMGSFAQRGCLSDADDYSKLCDNNPDLCKLCTEPNCNGQDAVVVRDKCYACNEENPYCFAHVDNSDDQSKVEKTCEAFLNYEVKCFTYTNNNQITRGCLNGIREISPPECLGENSDNCEICTGALCNSNKILENDDTCIDCDSLDDPNCNDPEHFASVIKDCFSDPGKITDHRCYHKIGTNTKRGCITDLDDDMLAECAENKESCKTCSGDNCNKKLDFTTCYGCDSTTENTCVDRGSNSVICDDYEDKCLTLIIEPGETVRGCTKEIITTEDFICSSRNCTQCSENNCNGEMFPTDRLKCVKCNSENKPDCLEISATSITTYSATCLNYVSDDSCFTVIHANLNVTRGCISDQNAAAIECINKKTFCDDCKTDNCNTILMHYDPILSCIQCNQSDPKCEWGFDENDAEACTQRRFFGEIEQCYTYQTDDEIQRGCTLDDAKCLTEDATCTTICKTEGCNSSPLTRSECIICDSTDITQKFCESEIEDGKPATCVDIQRYEDRGCYTYKTETHVHRGCVSTLTKEDFDYCSNDDNLDCEICLPDGCNTQEPNYASRLYYLSTLTLLCFSLLVKLLN